MTDNESVNLQMTEKDNKQILAKQSKNIVDIRVTLTGIEPGMLMNPMARTLLEELAGSQSKSASDKDQPLDDRAYKKIIKNEKGQIGIPSSYLRGALIYSGRYVKNGKSKLSTASTTTIFEFLRIKGEFIPFNNQNEPFHTHLCRGVLNNGGKQVAVGIIRPHFKNWDISFDITIDKNVCNVDIVKQLFDEAGKKAGLGDYRPSKRGPFGMFDVTEFKKLND